ncbi:MAG TPA: hydrogenase maturation nickel metallochaperone HypA [Fimbriimonadaceae bacterium]|nr:hydrogenase maturation nickel metallochaperone HypA [Fimbriimonadaceae bacterium]
MHETGIITQAVHMAIEAAEHAGAGRVTRLRLRVGAMAGVVPEALRFGFDVVTKGTIAEGAALEVDLVTVACRCAAGCGTFSPPDAIFACPTCGRLSTDVVAGRELDVVEVEVG